MMEIEGNLRPLIVLHRIPTSGELRFLKHFARCYKATHPAAKKHEVWNVVQQKFESKNIRNPIVHSKRKPVMQP